MSKPTQADFIKIIASKISGFKEFAEAFGKERFLVYKSEVHASEEKGTAWDKEDAEMEAIADAFEAEITESDGQFSLFFHFDRRNPGGFLEIVDAGMPASLAGGDEGTSHNPDGTTYETPTPKPFWHDPVPGYAKPATGVINEIRTMLADLFRTEMNEAIESSKKEILQLVKEYTAERIKAATGG